MKIVKETKLMEKGKILFFILIFSLLNQWIRWLPVYLSSVSIQKCQDLCDQVSFTPTCISCASDDEACSDCHECRMSYDSSFYNFEDGVCMTTTQYGVITGMGFAFTFSTFGLFAGYFVDISGSWGNTVLGVSAFFCGALTLVSSYSVNFFDVLILRAFLGALQAFGAPASIYLITSHFTESHSRLIGNTAYTVGLYIGAGLSSLSTIFSGAFGWRLTCALIGYVGIAVAIAFELTIDIAVQCSSSNRYAEYIEGNSEKEVKRGVAHEEEPLLSHANISSTRQTSVADFRNESYAGKERSMSASSDTSNNSSSNSENSAIPKNSAQGISNKSNGVHPVANVLVSEPFASTGDKDGKLLSDISSGGVGYTTLHDIAPSHGYRTAIRRGSHLLSSQDLASCSDSYPHTHSHLGGVFSSDVVGDGLLHHHESRERDRDRDVSDTDSSISELSFAHSLDLQRDSHKNILMKFFSSVWNLCCRGDIAGAIPLLLLGSCLRFLASILVFVYTPVLIARKFPTEDNIFSMFNAIVVLSCGSFSSFMGGRIGQMAINLYGLGGLARLVSASCFLSIFPFIFAFQVNNFWVCMGLLSLGYLVGEAWMGAAMAMLQSLAPRRGQGLAMSIFLFLNWNLAALGTGRSCRDVSFSSVSCDL